MAQQPEKSDPVLAEMQVHDDLDTALMDGKTLIDILCETLEGQQTDRVEFACDHLIRVLGIIGNAFDRIEGCADKLSKMRKARATAA